MADIIFVVDTSGSMGQESAYLMDNINAFGRHLNNSGIDYRVVLIGKHNSWLCVRPPLAAKDCSLRGPRFLKIEQEIDSWNALQVLINTPNSGTVNGARFPDIKGTYVWGRATTTNLGVAGYAEFLRPKAAKTIIVISDDDSGRYYGKTPAAHCWDSSKNGNPIEAGEICARSWIQDLRSIDSQNLFKPTPELPLGFAFHAISGHNCPSESQWGYQQSWTYDALTQLANGTLFKICEQDWSPMFTIIAENVESTTARTGCTHTVPRSSSDPALLLGDLEPDTPFDLKFAYLNPLQNNAKQTISITRSTASAGGTECPSSSAPSANQPQYKVDDAAAPSVVTLCDAACNVINQVAGEAQISGNLSFTFKPFAKLASVTVSGRGQSAAGLFGPTRKLRPALTFPAQHPALSPTRECALSSSRPTIPKTGQAIFVEDSCPQRTGVELFYALDPNSGRSRTFAPGSGASGITMFFFVNTMGETYFGIQIGHYTDAADEGLNGDYGVVDVILSGEAKTANSLATWVLQDGASQASDYIDPRSSDGRSRVTVQTLKGKTAGGVLGPLPAYNFCIDVVIVEASVGVNSAKIVDFVQNSGANGACTPTMTEVTRSVFDNGGLRFCADACTGNSNINGSNSVQCYTRKDGKLVCPNDGVGAPGVSTPSSAADGTPSDDNGAAPGDSGGINYLIAAVLVGTGVLLVLIIGVVYYRHRRRRAGGKYPESQAPAIAMTSSKRGVGTPNTTRRRTSCAAISGSSWDLVYDPETGDEYYYNSVTGESSWDLPEDVVLPSREPSLRVPSTAQGGVWCTFTTHDGYTAYAHTETGEVAWDLPEGATLEKASESWKSKSSTAESGGQHDRMWSEFQVQDGHEVEFSSMDMTAGFSNPMHGESTQQLV
jgi:hypothetical protein